MASYSEAQEQVRKLRRHALSLAHKIARDNIRQSLPFAAAIRAAVVSAAGQAAFAPDDRLVFASTRGNLSAAATGLTERDLDT